LLQAAGARRGEEPEAEENARISSIANQKLGIDTPPSDTTMTTRSSNELRRSAASLCWM